MSSNDGSPSASCCSEVCDEFSQRNTMQNISCSPRRTETESQFIGDNRDEHNSATSTNYEYSSSCKNSLQTNKYTEGQQQTRTERAIEIVTIDESTGQRKTIRISPRNTTLATDGSNDCGAQNNDIPLQCLECMRSEQLNYRNNSSDQSEQNSPKKKGFCAPVFQHVICRMAILTVFFVVLSFLCFINIYLFIFIFVSIVVVIFVNLGAQDEQFEE